MGRLVLLIMMMILGAIQVSSALGSKIASDSTSLPGCRFPPHAIEGQQIQIGFLLSSDPKIDKKNVHISKIAEGTRIGEPRSAEEFIVELSFNVTTQTTDNYTREGYIYGGIDEDHFLTISIEKVGPQHDGIYIVEHFKDLPYVCYLKVLDDAHREDCKDWKNMASRQTTVIIILGLVILGLVILVLVILGLVILVLVIVFRARSTKQGQEETTDDKNAPGTPSGDISVQMRGFRELRKRTAASRKKTGKGETSQDDSSGQEETTDASGAPSADISLLMLGVRADEQSSGEGCNSFSNATSRAKDDTDLCEVEITTDDTSSEHRAGDPSTEAASSSMPLLGETGGQGATPRTMQSFNSRGDSRQRLRNHNPYIQQFRKNELTMMM